MNTLAIIILSLVLCFIVFALVAAWYIFIIASARHVCPQFAVKTKNQALNITEVG